MCAQMHTIRVEGQNPVVINELVQKVSQIIHKKHSITSDISGEFHQILKTNLFLIATERLGYSWMIYIYIPSLGKLPVNINLFIFGLFLLLELFQQ